MTKSDLRRLRNKLPRGYNNLIIERTDLSLATVSAVMNGHRKNQLVLDTAFNILQEELTKEQQQKELLAS